jgi:photosynthetic reaction center H subunit
MNTGTGAITGYFDVAQIALYVFWGFFAGLIYYLHREDKREGYPLESDRSDRSGGRVKVQGFPAIPKPKIYRAHDGQITVSPREEKDPRTIMAKPSGPFPGAPLVPTGNPMLDGVGPASYALRATHPDTMVNGEPMIVPLRVDPSFSVSVKDFDPRGMEVYGADKVLAGVVSDLWVDRGEPQIRYLEVETLNGRHVLLPIYYTRFNRFRRRVNVKSILGSQFATVPANANPDYVTRREEDQIMAYYASGHMYATAARSEPLI